MPPTAEATPALVRIGAVVGHRAVANERAPRRSGLHSSGSSGRGEPASRPLVQAASTQQIVVGLIDTGCDVANKNLNVVGGVDFTSDNSYGLDANGHGTHVAGVRARVCCVCSKRRHLPGMPAAAPPPAWHACGRLTPARWRACADTCAVSRLLRLPRNATQRNAP
jgi:hypothetical protein